MVERENIAPEASPKPEKPVAPTGTYRERVPWAAIGVGISALILLFLIGGLYLTIGNKSEALNNRITSKTEEVNKEVTGNKVKLGVLEERTKRIEANVGEIKSDIDRIGLKLDEAIGKLRKTENEIVR